MRVLLLGGTGTIGRATAHALSTAGHEVTALVRAGSDRSSLGQCTLVEGDVTAERDLRRAFEAQPVQAVVSCIASRTGVARDAWNIDYRANLSAVSLAETYGARTFVLLSAICVQKPHLAFQRAKLAFETELQGRDLDWSIVRPTAFFKSLSGQIDRLRAGKPFLVFGDGTLTSCKPISDRDLAEFLVRCIDDPALRRKVLPIGGPGPALTPRAQGMLLFETLGIEPKFKSVPPGLLRLIAGGLSLPGWVIPKLGEKAELARIGHYYATESMLVWDTARSVYDAEATPEYGTDTLAEHYRRLVSAGTSDDRGAQTVF